MSPQSVPQDARVDARTCVSGQAVGLHCGQLRIAEVGTTYSSEHAASRIALRMGIPHQPAPKDVVSLVRGAIGQMRQPLGVDISEGTAASKLEAGESENSIWISLLRKSKQGAVAELGITEYMEAQHFTRAAFASF